MAQHRKSLRVRPHDRTESSSGDSVMLERTKLWIAITSIAAAFVVGVFSLFQFYIQSQRVQTVSAAIRDTEDIRAALQKPLEGVWQYRLAFSRYFGRDSRYISTGTAIFLWEPAKRQYQVFVGYSISKEWEKEKVVTGFLGGTLPADELGWPAPGFELAMKYLERTGTGEFASPLSVTFTFTNGEYRKSPDGKRAEQVVARYGNSRSSGRMMLSR
jgi:hypothetical protein